MQKKWRLSAASPFKKRRFRRWTRREQRFVLRFVVVRFVV